MSDAKEGRSIEGRPTLAFKKAAIARSYGYIWLGVDDGEIFCRRCGEEGVIVSTDALGLLATKIAFTSEDSSA